MWVCSIPISSSLLCNNSLRDGFCSIYIGLCRGDMEINLLERKISLVLLHEEYFLSWMLKYLFFWSSDFLTMPRDLMERVSSSYKSVRIAPGMFPIECLSTLSAFWDSVPNFSHSIPEFFALLAFSLLYNFLIIANNNNFLHTV